MGIVRLPGRDGVRLSTDARERERPLALSNARDVGQWHVGVAAPVGESVAKAGATHSAFHRTRVRHGPPSEGEA